MSKPRPHADLIKAWADGAVIEMFDPVTRTWHVVDTPAWSLDKKYRISPSNHVRFLPVLLNKRNGVFTGCSAAEEHAVRASLEDGFGSRSVGILRLEFDHETYDLVSATLEKVK